MNGRHAMRLLDEAGPTMSVPAAAHVLGISPWLLRKLIKEGTAPVKVLRLGARYRISTRSVRHALDEVA